MAQVRQERVVLGVLGHGQAGQEGRRGPGTQGRQEGTPAGRRRQALTFVLDHRGELLEGRGRRIASGGAEPPWAGRDSA